MFTNSELTVALRSKILEFWQIFQIIGIFLVENQLKC